MRPTLIILIGLSASGKSTKAKELAIEHNAIIVSSDAIRGEFGEVIDQSKNSEVFKIFHKRIKDGLSNRYNVIADATNITIKSRRQIFETVRNIDCNIIGYVMTKPVDKCIEDNIYREYPVPHHVIMKQMMNYQIPFYEEGFDRIIIDDYKSEYIDRKRLNLEMRMRRFNQNNPHHKHNLYYHSKSVAMQFKDNVLSEAGYLHDCMKLECGSIDKDGISHYFNHENMSAYYILSHPYLTTISNIKDFLELLFIINYHMLFFNNINEQKWIRIFGDDKFSKLKSFHIADELSSKNSTFNNGKRNIYIDNGEEYLIGYTSCGDKFLIDKEDLDTVLKYGFVIKNKNDNDFRLVSGTGGKMLFLHRLLLNESDKNIVIDHIDRDQTNNRKSNLRKCTQKQNSYNCGVSKNNTTGTSGVSKMKNGKFRAYINDDYKQIHLGVFDKIEEAINVRDIAEEKYFGQFKPREI